MPKIKTKTKPKAAPKPKATTKSKKTDIKKQPEPDQKDQTLSDEELRELYEKDTGKNAEWRGKITKGYLEWKKEKLE